VNQGLLAVALIVAQATVVSGVAEAAPKAKPVTEKRVPKAKAKKAPTAEEAAAADAKAESAEAAPEAAPTAAEPQGTVQSAGTKATTKKEQKGAVKTEEDPEGVKSYEFSAIEVEGRLRSPQILYFLRRVRAEFDAGGLGHRSFLGELRDTRNNAAFR
jgi:hypothetical protein